LLLMEANQTFTVTHNSILAAANTGLAKVAL